MNDQLLCQKFYMGNEKHGKKKTGLGGKNLQNIIFLNIKKKR